MKLQPGDAELIALSNEFGCSTYCFKCSAVRYAPANPHIITREAFLGVTMDGAVQLREHPSITLDDVILCFRPVPLLADRLWIPLGEDGKAHKVNHLRHLSKEMVGRVVGLTTTQYVWTLPFAFSWEADAVHYALNK